ncbi:MAG: 5'-nucleotidase C-terminal domain-containing protein [Pseudomonadota bacterium]
MTSPARGLAASAVFALAGCASAPQPDAVVLSVLGVNDTHGEMAGLVAMSGYVEALRSARRDNGAVVLLDAGDMWQGTLESNLAEGAPVVEAYNAMRFDAAAIGNHEFDFGPEGSAMVPESPVDDPRGALKARATEAQFPLLAANLIDTKTEAPVDWPNVRTSILVERAGVKVGIVGVTTADTLETTIRGNTYGLAIAPLAATIEREARTLRGAGADLVIAVAHAGGHCEAFEDPFDLTSCDRDEEIFRVARALPRGLVDQIIAGHTHAGVAHVVNGIAITESLANARAFGRVDYRIDSRSGAVLERRIFPPQRVCRQDRAPCEGGDAAVDGRYADHPLQTVPVVTQIADRAYAAAETVKRRLLGVTLSTAITRQAGPASALGRLMTDAVREATGADVAIHNVVGGIRADLPAGPLTYGDVFRAFPFDNRVAVLELSGRELRTLLAPQITNVKRRAGLSGLQVHVACAAQFEASIELRRSDGSIVDDEDRLSVAANDYLLFGGDRIFAPITPPDGFDIDLGQPRVRDVWADWFSARGGTLSAADFEGAGAQRWFIADDALTGCEAPTST